MAQRMFEIVVSGTCSVGDADGNVLSSTTFSSRPVETISVTEEQLRTQFGLTPEDIGAGTKIDVPLDGTPEG